MSPSDKNGDELSSNSLGGGGFGTRANEQRLRLVEPVFLYLPLCATAETDHRPNLGRWSKSLQFGHMSFDELSDFARPVESKHFCEADIAHARLVIAIDDRKILRC